MRAASSSATRACISTNDGAMNFTKSERHEKSRWELTDGRLIRRQEVPLVPAASIAGRALVTVIAIMTFLAAITACTAMMIADAAQGWNQAIAQEMTIQVRPMEGHDLEAETAKAADIARGTPGIAEVQVYTKAQSEALLQPWLGSGLDLADLPIPRLIVLKLDRTKKIDIDALRQALANQVAGASLDDHRIWLQRLALMAGTVVVVAVIIFLLVMIAMVLAVGFATRGAMAGNREIIEVLHFVGAADSYISRQFQRHFFSLGLRGGLLGGGCRGSHFSPLRRFFRLSARDAGRYAGGHYVRQFRTDRQGLYRHHRHRRRHCGDDRHRLALHRLPSSAKAGMRAEIPVGTWGESV